jgi:hypothetical protein
MKWPIWFLVLFACAINVQKIIGAPQDRQIFNQIPIIQRIRERITRRPIQNHIIHQHNHLLSILHHNHQHGTTPSPSNHHHHHLFPLLHGHWQFFQTSVASSKATTLSNVASSTTFAVEQTTTKIETSTNPFQTSTSGEYFNELYLIFTKNII